MKENKLIRRIALVLYWTLFIIIYTISIPITPIYWLLTGDNLQDIISVKGKEIRYSILRTNCKNCKHSKYWILFYECTYCKRYLLANEKNILIRDNYEKTM
ncbi:MAG: hypothetical protein EOL97_12620 [Spirochaetia bacterium]|nr:hypothetical protein [Spirochaetia bacterium]